MPRTSSVVALIAVVVACAAVLAPGASAEPAGPAAGVVGTWAGVLHQDGREQGQVRFIVRRSGTSSPQGTVWYTGLGGCSGKWVFLGRAGDAAWFRERITRGADATCKGLGTVTLHVTNRRELAYRWTDGVIVSRAVVTRVR